jgi:uncharacterized protein YecE (DUF72 family)
MEPAANRGIIEPMRVSVGTSGFAYKEWKGAFYPADIRPEQMLAYYASRLRSVEINNTFYRMPTEKVLLQWAGEVPENFTFVLKASQKVTHSKRLKDAGSELEYFLRTANVLGKRLGPTLFQLPPNLKKDLVRLRDFLALIPRTWRAAFEFRHRSWFDEEVLAALSDAGAAWCVAETDPDESDLPVLRRPTAGFGYLRLRKAAYSEAELGDWAGWLAAQPFTEAFVFFKHEDEATGPRLAEAFTARLPSG